MNPFTHNITRLLDFQGRQNRQPFWLWMLIVYGFQMIVSLVGMIPLMTSYYYAMQPIILKDQAYLDAHPEVAQKLIAGAIAPMMNGIIIMTALIALIFTVMMAAATVRRLHDSNKSGWWAAPYFVLQLLVPLLFAVTFPRLFDMMATLGPQTSPEQVDAMMAPWFQSIGLIWTLSMVNFVFMVVLLVFLVTGGTRGPNRFGADPLGHPDLPNFHS